MIGFTNAFETALRAEQIEAVARVSDIELLPWQRESLRSWIKAEGAD
ncbi:hypothetical protein [Microbacterium sp. SORGH_AS_0862]|nr:hypothetical protein [Microbacterium sp. SORGH_AS_0862]